MASDGTCYTGKYCDAEDSSRVPDSGDFLPFMRCSEVLDPAHADSPLPVSREPTDMVKARRAYQRELNPAKYGHTIEHTANRHVSSVFPQSVISVLYDYYIIPTLFFNLCQSYCACS